ncbi:hypothetical protein [Paenisporosarcina sp. OV554]|uniref:hypothetical protein n=1 Tax=Paenisporosarcina sp. OV554 TaxID=2135694 RepID=UPI000D35321D|nr:hypothetical protein [Paenisporosarcina sp. OV554]PUB10805.1 hypothetical protein C8K15_11669 [Paenisporosarcina sp. OV554]
MQLSENINQGYKKEEYKGLALDVYITSKDKIKRSIADKEFVIGYKKIREDGSFTKKFATLMIVRGYPVVVLHLGEKKDREGLQTQKELDEKIGNTYVRNGMQINEKPHEVFIRLDWVRSLEEISPYIDEAYEKRT